MGQLYHIIERINGRTLGIFRMVASVSKRTHLQNSQLANGSNRRFITSQRYCVANRADRRREGH